MSPAGNLAEARPVHAPLRDALGQFATGIAVLTTRGLDGRAVGLTINSFTSVSLEPPLVAWSLSRTSRSLDHFLAARTVAIHVLSDHQEAVARRFASSRPDRFAGLDIEIGPGGVPLLDGALARFVCAPHASHVAGDHLLFIGRVERWERRPGAPLLFFGSSYRRLPAD